MLEVKGNKGLVFLKGILHKRVSTLIPVEFVKEITEVAEANDLTFSQYLRALVRKEVIAIREHKISKEV